jgi:hypothetical protein
MKEQFDKKLAKKIADTFSQHEEPFDPKEWEKISATYFKNPRKGKWLKWALPISGIAASLMLFMIFLPPAEEKEDQRSLGYLETVLQSEDPEQTETTPQISSERHSPNAETSANPSQPLTKSGSAQIQPNEKRTNAVESVKDILVPGASAGENQQESLPAFQAIRSDEKFTAIPKAPSLIIPQAPDEASAIASIQDWLNEVEESKESFANKEKASDPLKIGILLAPQTISNATQSLNLGAGVMSEFAFSKRLKLDVGIAYARQQMVPDVSGRGNLFTTQSADLNQIRTLSNLSNSFISLSDKLSFGQVEIPLNLKYRIIENKSSGWYLMSGVSNMMYFNQEKVTTINAANFSSANFGVAGAATVQTFESISTPSASQGSVNTGQMLNLGFAFEQNLKNGTFVYIEPFYKLPLGNQTFAEQVFSIGGINLRMNFQFKK